MDIRYKMKRLFWDYLALVSGRVHRHAKGRFYELGYRKSVKVEGGVRCA